METVGIQLIDEERKAADAGFVDLIQEIITEKSSLSEIGRALNAALQLAVEEQTRRKAAQPPEAYKSLREIFAEMIFGGSHQKGYELESEAVMETIREYAVSAVKGNLLKQSVRDERAAIELSKLDPLTQLFNRREIATTLENWLGPLRRETDRVREFAVIMIDLDHFKNINDTYGHNFGDVVLEKFAALLKQHFRDNDVIGRWGGEEFIVLMETHEENVQKKLEELRDRLQNPLGDGLPVVTASIGWTIHYPEAVETPRKLIDQADKASYFVKENGRNRVIEYDPNHHLVKKSDVRVETV